jgi:hypothetical protein
VTLERDVGIANAALRVAIVLAVSGLSFALFLRFRPPEGRGVALTADQRAVEPAESLVGDLNVVTAATTVPDSLATLADTAAPAPPPVPPPMVVTDVVLLPCNEPNPRPDGRFLLPPHDPNHRTIVGLPSGPGEPKRGLVIPPHDPGTESRIPVLLVPLDSALEHTIRIPPHDPSRYKLIRPDTLPCVQP